MLFPGTHFQNHIESRIFSFRTICYFEGAKQRGGPCMVRLTPVPSGPPVNARPNALCAGG
jgi:hypothetical protein